MDELKNIAPELSKLKKEVPFSTPKNYFDDFSARMQSRLETETQTPTKQKTRVITFLKPLIGLAASFALIFMLVHIPLKSFISSEINQVGTNSETITANPEMLDIMQNLDESSFFALLNETENTDAFTDEELILYVSANFTDYEIFEITEN